jgi:hypothetical protein
MANAAGFSRAIGPNAQYDLALSTIDIPCTTAFNTHILPMRCPRRKVGLSKQFSLFADRLSGPEGLRYADEFVSPAAEKTLIGHIAILPLQPFQVWPIRRQTPRGLVRISIRLHHAPARGGRSDPRVTWVDHREGRSFPRPRHPNWPGPSPSTTSVSASVGTGTSRTSTGCSACRWARRASSGFAGPPTPSGSVSRSRLGRVRFT